MLLSRIAASLRRWSRSDGKTAASDVGPEAGPEDSLQAAGDAGSEAGDAADPADKADRAAGAGTPRRRPGVASLEVVLCTAVVFPFTVLLFWIGLEAVKVFHHVVAVLVMWPFI